MKKTSNSKILQVFVDLETYEELEYIVNENRSTISATVRGLIEDFVEREQHKPQTYL